MYSGGIRESTQVLVRRKRPRLVGFSSVLVELLDLSVHGSRGLEAAAPSVRARARLQVSSLRTFADLPAEYRAELGHFL